ncbi:MAG: hypothetical protein ABI655_05155, partial [Phenylobacterium sp.]
MGVTSVGSEFLVNTTTVGNQDTSQITTLANGGFVVTWLDLSQTGADTSGNALRAEAFDAGGTPVGAEILVNTTTAGTVFSEQITDLSGGGFAVAWTDTSASGGDISGLAVRAQVFTATCTPVGTEILVNTATTGNQTDEQITALSNGGFVVTWDDYSGTGGDTSAGAVRAQVFTATGARVGTEMLVNTSTLNDQSSSQITALSNGAFAVTWTDGSQSGGDTSGNAVRGQIFTTAAEPTLWHLGGTTVFTEQSAVTAAPGLVLADADSPSLA